MAEVSMYTKVVLATAERMRVAQEAARSARPIPVMQEWKQPHELREWLGGMSEEGRRAFREKVGIAEMVRLTRRGRDG